MDGMAAKIREGGIETSAASGVFYNPEMELCRDIFSLAVGSLPAEKISLLDAMCASGIRGLRYKKENKNVAKLALVDMSRRAILLAKKNALANKVKCKCEKDDARLHLYKNEYDFLELDPFGSPQPFLFDAARSFRTKKMGHISVTATDMAVLCGAHHAACLKNYFCTPLNNEFCHENALRILASTVIREFAACGIGAVPIFSFSHLHYVKILFSLSKDAASAVEAVKKTGYVSYCPKCCFREVARFPKTAACAHCGAPLMLGGPLYTGALWDSALVARMKQLNAKRGYKNAKKIEALLSTIAEESAIAAYGYYDLHVLAKKTGKPILSMDDALQRLRRAGFSASRTHFCPTAVRTDAPHGKVLALLGASRQA